MRDLEQALKNKYKFFTTVFLTILAALLLSVSVGFSALNQNLSIAGDLDYEQDNKLLYSVLKREARIGTYAKQYTGEHHDSYTEQPTKEIYYWYAPDTTTGNNMINIIKNKDNVLFAGFCWQIYRTTDTGGVKMVYNGIPNDGKCTSSTLNIGSSSFNSSSRSVAYVGYMYNKVYETSKLNNDYFLVDDYKRIDTIDYYASEITYDQNTETYSLVNAQLISTLSDYTTLKGKFVLSNGSNTLGEKAYYVIYTVTNPNRIAYKAIENGETSTSAFIGDSYTLNNDNTYTINNPTEYDYKDFNTVSKPDNYYCEGSPTCTNIYHVICAPIWTGCRYFNPKDHLYKYSESVSYNGTTYTLTGDIKTIWDIDQNIDTLATHHYTCMNNSTQCSEVNYLNYYSKQNLYYVQTTFTKLSGVSGIEEAITNMTSSNDINTTNSTIKSVVDNWYSNNMTSYTSYLEDTIFCNDRTISNIGAFNPNGGNVTKSLYFTEDDFTCTNDTDKFSINNPKARLLYPVGLVMHNEKSLITNRQFFAGSSIWYMTPISFTGNYAEGHVLSSAGTIIDTDGRSSSSKVSHGGGVRPVISLKPGTEYTSGTGTKDDPYIVE